MVVVDGSMATHAGWWRGAPGTASALASVVIVGLRPGVDGPPRRVLAEPGCEQQLRPGRHLPGVRPHVVHRFASFLGSWGLLPVVPFVLAPHSGATMRSTALCGVGSATRGDPGDFLEGYSA